MESYAFDKNKSIIELTFSLDKLHTIRKLVKFLNNKGIKIDKNLTTSETLEVVATYGYYLKMYSMNNPIKLW